MRATSMNTAVTAEPGANRSNANAFLLRGVGADPSHDGNVFRACVLQGSSSAASNSRHYPRSPRRVVPQPALRVEAYTSSLMRAAVARLLESAAASRGNRNGNLSDLGVGAS